MKVVFTDTFFKSFKSNVIDANTWYKFKFWQHKYWDFKQGIKNLIAYFKIVWNIYPYNGDTTFFSLTKKSLERLLVWIEKGHEVEESRLPKIKNIKRSIEILNNFLEDNFAERCGWEFDESKLFEPPTEENDNAIKESIKLQEEEWNELFILLKDIRSWWD